MMICPKCKIQIPDESRFCKECGSNVSGESGAEPAPGSAAQGVGQGATLVGPDLPSRSGSIGGDPTQPLEHAEAEPPWPSGPQVPLSARYEVIEEIGRGGFGAVFKALDRKLGRTVAVKRLLVERQAERAASQSLQRFIRESKIIADLNHRNIVQVYDADHDAEGYYIVMEYVDGGSLRDLLQEKGKLASAEAVALVKGIGQGLAYAHRKSLIHRDVKPANVLLRRDDDRTLVPKLVDFGLARLGAESDFSKTGYGIGTPYYMPPEQRRDAKSVNHTADIYALGKVFYELLTGEVPDSVDPSLVPPEYAEVIFKCVRTKPEDRYFSVDELLHALEELPLANGGGRSRQRVPRRKGTSPAACPQCGADNSGEARFCVGCGLGLFWDCPECDRKNSIHDGYCAGCGTDREGFQRVLLALQNMQALRQERKWSRILKEADLLPQDIRLSGTKGRKLLADIRALRSESETTLARQGELDREIQEALAEGDFQRALRLVMEYQGIDPANPEINGLLGELVRKNDEQDHEDALKAALAALDRQAFEEARTAFRDYLEKHPGGGHVAEVRQVLEEELPEAERTAELLALLKRAGELVADGKPDEAQTHARRVVEGMARLRYPERASAWLRDGEGKPLGKSGIELRAAACALIDSLQERHNRSDALMAEARAAVQRQELEQAESLLQSADEAYPGRLGCRRELEGVRARIRSVQEGLENCQELLNAARSHAAENRLSSCRTALDQLHGRCTTTVVPASATWAPQWETISARTRALAADLQAREARLSQLQQEARHAYEQQDYATCEAICQAATELTVEKTGCEALYGHSRSALKTIEQNLATASRSLGTGNWQQVEAACSAVLALQANHVEARSILAELATSLARVRRRRRNRRLATGLLTVLVVAVAIGGFELALLWSRVQFANARDGRQPEVALRWAGAIETYYPYSLGPLLSRSAYDGCQKVHEYCTTQRRAEFWRTRSRDAEAKTQPAAGTSAQEDLKARAATEKAKAGAATDRLDFEAAALAWYRTFRYHAELTVIAARIQAIEQLREEYGRRSQPPADADEAKVWTDSKAKAQAEQESAAGQDCQKQERWGEAEAHYRTAVQYAVAALSQDGRTAVDVESDYGRALTAEVTAGLDRSGGKLWTESKASAAEARRLMAEQLWPQAAATWKQARATLDAALLRSRVLAEAAGLVALQQYADAGTAMEKALATAPLQTDAELVRRRKELDDLRAARADYGKALGQAQGVVDVLREYGEQKWKDYTRAEDLAKTAESETVADWAGAARSWRAAGTALGALLADLPAYIGQHLSTLIEEARKAIAAAAVAPGRSAAQPLSSGVPQTALAEVHARLGRVDLTNLQVQLPAKLKTAFSEAREDTEFAYHLGVYRDASVVAIREYVFQAGHDDLSFRMVWVPGPPHPDKDASGESEPGFFIDKCETTVGQFESFWRQRPDKDKVGTPEWSSLLADIRGDLTSPTKDLPLGNAEYPTDWPVVRVTYFEACRFAEWSGRPATPEARRRGLRRLPTVAQWCLAAFADPAGGKETKYPWGDEWQTQDGTGRNRCNLSDRNARDPAGNPLDEWERIAPSIAFAAQDRSRSGCVGMAGNVSEWCLAADDEAVQAPVLGGNCLDSAEPASVVVSRETPARTTKGGRFPYVGLRCVLNLPPNWDDEGTP